MDHFIVKHTRHTMPFDVVINEYSIEGELKGESYISALMIREVKHDAKAFIFCGYRFLVMEYEPWSMRFRVRLDTPRARIVKALEKIWLAVNKINCRLILTAYVWGLQDKPREGEVIRWRRLI